MHSADGGRVSGRSLSREIATAILVLTQTGLAATVSFQQGAGGYVNASDTWIGSATPTADNTQSGVVEWDGEDGGGQNYGLLRFDGLFGSAPGQIPIGATVTSAVLVYEVTNAGSNATMNEVLVDWAPPASVTWNNFGGEPGVQDDEFGAQVGTASGAAGTQSIDVTSSVAAWTIAPALNRGWIFRPTGGTDGVEFVSSNADTISTRPKLTVTYTLQTGVELSLDAISTVAGKGDIPLSVSIPPVSNRTNPVSVSLTTSDPAVAVPVGAAGGTLVVTFAAGAPHQQLVHIDIGATGTARLTTTNDAGLDNDTAAVSVGTGAVSVAPAWVNSGTGTTVPVKLAITPGSNDTRDVKVTLTSGNTAVILPAGASDASLTATFTAGGPNFAWVQLNCGQAGETVLTTTNDGGLSNVSLPGQVFAGFNFTVTADPREKVSGWNLTLGGIREKISTPGVFHVSPGDIDPVPPLRAAIDDWFGPAFPWFPLVGNHEVETPQDMTWIRAEYHTGNGQRAPLKTWTNQDGPAGSVETTFSWDYGNTHFISLNQYWNGGSVPGSDVAVDGDIVPALHAWLAADLAANTRPVVFVFAHEPAFPANRHVGDSLDKYPSRRDAFWALLHDYGVQAFFCGHTHFYSRHQSVPDGTWQIDVGNAGNDPGDGQTFANVIVTGTQVTYEIWRNQPGSWVKAQTWSVPVGPRLITGGTPVNRTIRIGLSHPADTFNVSATTGVPVHYDVVVDGAPDWLTVNPANGISAGQDNSHQLAYATAGLAAGQYQATIRITSPQVVNSPRTFEVRLEVRYARADLQQDNDVDQSDFGTLQTCLTGQSMATLPPHCAATDLNSDGFIDPRDIQIFLDCFSGPDQPIPPACP